MRRTRARGASDDDVGRVADQRGGASDVRRDDLDDHEWDRVDVERIGKQKRDRPPVVQVVEKRRQDGGRDGEQAVTASGLPRESWPARMAIQL